ncbi:transposon TX1 uncharacterized [Tanacetum coccineum]
MVGVSQGLTKAVDSRNFGPKPFRFFDKWIGDGGYAAVITDSWASYDSTLNGTTFSPDLVLKNKIKKLRHDIKIWTSNKIAAQNKSREELSHHLLEWDVRAEDGLITDRDINKREEWVHVNGIWCDSPDEIKHAALVHFSARFKESSLSRPTFNSSLFKRLSVCDACFLESSISLDKTKEAVWGCAGSKALGPDGLNFKFLKSNWETLKNEFIDCIKYFKATGNIANGCNPFFIVLIPKKADPLGFSDYRPIGLIGRIYKVISKILANRLAKVISSVIGPNQTAFIVARQILNGCLIANEIIRMDSIEKSNFLLFKVDFEKAFDCVNWNFILNVMRQMGFGVKWRK